MRGNPELQNSVSMSLDCFIAIAYRNDGWFGLVDGFLKREP